MKNLIRVLLFTFTIVVSADLAAFANCTFSATAPTCNTMTGLGTQWCDINLPGSNTDPILKVCDNTVNPPMWREIEKTIFSLDPTATVPIKLDDDLTVTGTRTLDFGTNRLINIATPTATTDAARKDYVDTLTGGLAVSASTSLDFGANRLKNIATPTVTSDAARKDYVDTLSGGLAVGASTSLDFGANRLKNIATPTATTDAARKDYVDTLAGGLVVGASTTLDFGANKLINVADPTANQDAANKAYVDTQISSSSPVDPLFSSTALGVADSVGVDETLIGTGVGSLTLPANSLAVGDVIRIKTEGYLNPGGSPPGDATIKAKLGSTVLSSGTASIGVSSNLYWAIEYTITVRSLGANGSVFGTGRFIWKEDTDNNLNVLSLSNTEGTLIDTTAAQIIDITCNVGEGSVVSTNATVVKEKF